MATFLAIAAETSSSLSSLSIEKIQFEKLISKKYLKYFTIRVGRVERFFLRYNCSLLGSGISGTFGGKRSKNALSAICFFNLYTNSS